MSRDEQQCSFCTVRSPVTLTVLMSSVSSFQLLNVETVCRCCHDLVPLRIFQQNHVFFLISRRVGLKIVLSLLASYGEALIISGPDAEKWIVQYMVPDWVYCKKKSLQSAMLMALLACTEAQQSFN